MTDSNLQSLPQGTLPPAWFYGVKADGTSQKWTPRRVLNPMDYGAVGDGVADDTIPVQNCLNDAFGTWASPHAASSGLNIPVYLPTGFKVTSRGSATVTACAAGTAGVIRLTLSTALAAAFVEGAPVLVTNVNAEANGPRPIHIVNSTHVELVGSTFVSATVNGPGAVMKLPCLMVRSMQSGYIFGDGRFTSGLSTADTNCAIIATNGCSYSKFEDFGLFFGDGGIGFDWNWQGGAGEPVSLQSCKWEGLYVAWTGSNTFPVKGLYGIALAGGNWQGDTVKIENCYISGCDAAIVTLCGNVGAVTIEECNMAANNTGIRAANGCISAIIGINFQLQQAWDIELLYSAGECTSIIGCRDENGANFLKTGPAELSVHVSACGYLGAGWMHSGGSRVTFTTCNATGGTGFDEGGDITIENCRFPAGYLTTGSQRYRHLDVTPQEVTTKTGATYTFTGGDSSSLVQFNSASAQTVTLPRTHTNGTFLEEGATIDVIQIGAGRVTFQAGSSVTVQSANGLKLAHQWSRAKLTVIAPDVWLLSGDTSTT